MDFAFTAAFIAIACSLWRGKVDLLPWLVSIVVVAVTLLTGWLDSSWSLILGGCAGALTAGLPSAGPHSSVQKPDE
jgi:predicted branched-subunit amino acid permease